MPGGNDFRVGPWLVEPTLNRISRNGASRHLEPKVMQVLVCLSKASGQVVSKQQLVDEIWKDTFVTDDVLTRSISELRDAFGDDARNPAIIQTIPKHGYRLLPHVASAEKAKPRISWKKIALIPLVAVFVAVLALILRSPTMPKVTGSRQLTNTVGEKFNPIIDGNRLLFWEYHAGNARVMQAPLNGGEAVPLPELSAHSLLLLDISPDGSEGLFRDVKNMDPHGFRMWTASSLGGTPKRLGDVVAFEAKFSPDGKLIAYARGDEGIYLVQRDGTNPRKIASIPLASRLRWSPDGTRLRYTVSDEKGERRIWEVPAAGGEPFQVFPEWAHTRGGDWTPDGRFFIFHATRGGVDGLWAAREKSTFSFRQPQPVALITVPMEKNQARLSPDGKRIVLIGKISQGELLRYDLSKGVATPLMPGTSVWADPLAGADISNDGQWVTYIRPSDKTLWRARADGTEKLQLTSGELGSMLPNWEPSFPRWSPDGNIVVFAANLPGNKAAICIVKRDGGTVEKIVEEPGWDIVPEWSPDGKWIIYSHWTTGPGWELRLVEWPSRKTESLPKPPGVIHLASGTWSPDGRYIAAAFNDAGIVLYDVRAQRWSHQVSTNINTDVLLIWSRDSKSIYFIPKVDPVLKSFNVADGSIRTVGKLERGAALTSWGRAPGNSLLIAKDTTSSQIYSFDLELP